MTTIRSLSALVLASFLAACANMSSLPPAPDKAPKHNYVYQIGPGRSEEHTSELQSPG